MKIESTKKRAPKHIPSQKKVALVYLPMNQDTWMEQLKKIITLMSLGST